MRCWRSLGLWSYVVGGHLLASACFQTANVQPNTGLQLAPASTITPTVQSVAVIQVPELLPVVTVIALPTNIEGTDTRSPGENPTPESQLSAAQIEATSIVIEATAEAISTKEPTPLPTNSDTVDSENPTEGSIIKVYEPDEGSELPADSCIHIVRDGDTLYRIARQYNSTVYILVTLNNIAIPISSRSDSRSRSLAAVQSSLRMLAKRKQPAPLPWLYRRSRMWCRKVRVSSILPCVMA